MNVELSIDEIYMIANALNEEAARLEKMAKADTRKGHTFRQIGVVEAEAKTMRALTERLISKRAA